MPVAAEFFAGIGLVRLGLEQAGFQVTWSNDLEPAKATMYRANFPDAAGAHHYAVGDVAAVTATELPADLGLAWASFPCTDLSLAGRRDGLAGAHSSTFWHFTRILDELGAARPPVVALENVTGLATSRGGRDIAAAIMELNRLGYSVDVLAIDAKHFVPQSRPRIFLVAAQDPPPNGLSEHGFRPRWLDWIFADPELRTHRAALPPAPKPLGTGLAAVVENVPAADIRWWQADRTAAFLASLSVVQHARLTQLRAGRTTSYRTAYRRTRDGVPVWEIRSDEIAGCLRTARGGSSRQALVRAGRGEVRVRWMTGTEYARLMGAGDYRLEGLGASQVLFGFGDAVCVPVAAWLATHYLAVLC